MSARSTILAFGSAVALDGRIAWPIVVVIGVVLGIVFGVVVGSVDFVVGAIACELPLSVGLSFATVVFESPVLPKSAQSATANAPMSTNVTRPASTVFTPDFFRCVIPDPIPERLAESATVLLGLAWVSTGL